jgi:hypothetical protein
MLLFFKDICEYVPDNALFLLLTSHELVIVTVERRLDIVSPKHQLRINAEPYISMEQLTAWNGHGEIISTSKIYSRKTKEETTCKA